MDNLHKLYDVVYEPPAFSVNSTELPGWAIPMLIITGVIILAAVTVKIVKGSKGKK